MSARTRPYIDENYTEMMQRLRESLAEAESVETRIQKWRQSSNSKSRLLHYFGDGFNAGDSVNFFRYTTAMGLELSGDLTFLSGGSILSRTGELSIKSRVVIGTGVVADPQTYADDLVIKSPGAAGLTISTSVGTSTSNILFGDDDNSDLGRVSYNHLTQSMSIYANGGIGFRMNSIRNVSLGNAIPKTAKVATAGSIQIKELAEAVGDDADYGQVWVKDTDPNELWFTDDIGVDHQITNNKAKLTAIGGFAIKLTNETGGNTVVGQLVITSNPLGADTDYAFETADGNSENVIGIVYEAGVAEHSEAWVVIAGIADVLMDGGGSVRGDRIVASGTAGSADVWNTGGAVTTHFREIGHCLETRTGAGLARCTLHFN